MVQNVGELVAQIGEVGEASGGAYAAEAFDERPESDVGGCVRSWSDYRDVGGSAVLPAAAVLAEADADAAAAGAGAGRTATVEPTEAGGEVDAVAITWIGLAGAATGASALAVTRARLGGDAAAAATAAAGRALSEGAEASGSESSAPSKSRRGPASQKRRRQS